MNDRKIVTRFAPSPTGFIHVGNVRSALYAWLWTRKNNGTFILRIEDTDKEREVEGSIAHILESLRWLGIVWDEGPEVGGPNGPYIQSERLDLYKKYAQKLIDKGLAYPDPYTQEELDLFRQKAGEEKRAFLYRDHRPETFEVWDGTKPLRFKTPEIKSYKWHDLVFGDLSAGPEALDDFVLIKSDGYPTYNFAHIVDDIEMGITLVMRGQEYISSTPKFLSVYEALGITPPAYACLPHIMAEGGKKKLGKRDGAKDILEYRDEGYLPEAMMNFLALLGWNPGDDREVMTKEELIQAFDISRVQKSGAQWNDEKLNWLNKAYISKLPTDNAYATALAYIPEELKTETIKQRIQRALPVIMERVSVWKELASLMQDGELSFITKNASDISYSNILLWKKNPDAKSTAEILSHCLSIVEKNTFDSIETIKEPIMKYAEEKGDRGSVLHPLRVALTNLEKSPDPFSSLYCLGKEESLTRIKNAVAFLLTLYN